MDGMTTEAAAWLAGQPRNDAGKVDITVVIEEGKKRGYCICPKPFRAVIDFTAEGNGLSEPFTCSWCEQPETRESWAFWYLERDAEGLLSAAIPARSRPPAKKSKTLSVTFYAWATGGARNTPRITPRRAAKTSPNTVYTEKSAIGERQK